MHVSFISLCKGKASKRTRAILDRYAQRNAAGTWLTPITQEALDSVHEALKAAASKNTAVACYRNVGNSQMALIWTIGRKEAFNIDGVMPVHTRKKPKQSCPWITTVKKVAAAAGLAHDLGKASVHFQNKLRTPQVVMDATRHEWISMHLLDILLREGVAPYDSRQGAITAWENSWEKLRAMGDKPGSAFNRFPQRYGEAVKSTFGSAQSLHESLLLSVVTHHGLFDPRSGNSDSGGGGGNIAKPEVTGHTRRETKNGSPSSQSLREYQTLSKRWTKEEANEMAHIIRKIVSIYHNVASTSQPNLNPRAWRAITLISRAALILADHEVSSRSVNKIPVGAASPETIGSTVAQDGVFANTTRSENQHLLNQTLPYHLAQVGQRAYAWADIFFNHNLPGVDPRTRNGLLLEKTEGRFAWQGVATGDLMTLRDEELRPTMVLNLASTGAGKTRMNLKAIAALTPENQPMRAVAAFNLRTLTLQTRDAFINQVNVDEKDLGCLVGDKLSRGLHNHPMFRDDENLTSDDGGAPEVEYVAVASKRNDLPDWLTLSLKRNPNLSALVGSPLLVSTIDYITHAGEPGKQGHHGHALLRIASSDLILDELDSYSPESIGAILRIVYAAGIFGRNVIVSSATLPETTAKVLVETFQTGVRDGGYMRGLPNYAARVVCLDNTQKPCLVMEDHQNFQDFYSAFLEIKRSELEEKSETYRRALVVGELISGNQSLEYQERKSAVVRLVAGQILDSCRILHSRHHHTVDNKRVSFGLVRVANVASCVAIAKHLIQSNTEQNSDIEINVCPYHAADLALRRKYKESKLDEIMNRKPGWERIFNTPDIHKRVSESPKKDVLFLVVATPVEEVGRDHDFDWAVIEPSSIGSIIQTAGRVNRHRLAPLDAGVENVHILRYNIKAQLRQPRAFLRPGFEIGKAYPSHDMSELLGATMIDIDTRLRFGEAKCLFSRCDDESIARQTETSFRAAIGSNGYSKSWVVRSYYFLHPLRSRSHTNTYRVRLDEYGQHRLEIQKMVASGWDGATSDWMETHNGTRLTFDTSLENEPTWWLCPSFSELLELGASVPSQIKELSMQFSAPAKEGWTPKFHTRAGGYWL